MDEQTCDAPARTEWAPVRADYEARYISRYAICLKYQIPMAELLERAEKNKWQRDDSDAVDRQILINQLLVLLQRQINQLEQSMSGSDKETAVLAKLSANLDKLIAMEKAAGRTSEAQETREMQDIRQKLAKRIDALTKG